MEILRNISAHAEKTNNYCSGTSTPWKHRYARRENRRNFIQPMWRLSFVRQDLSRAGNTRKKMGVGNRPGWHCGCLPVCYLPEVFGRVPLFGCLFKELKNPVAFFLIYKDLHERQGEKQRHGQPVFFWAVRAFYGRFSPGKHRLSTKREGFVHSISGKILLVPCLHKKAGKCYNN